MNPIKIEQLSGNGVTLVPKTKPFVLTPQRDEENGFWFVAIDDVDLYCTGETDVDLQECIHDFITYDWICLVLCDESTVHESAMPIRTKLMELFQQI